MNQKSPITSGCHDSDVTQEADDADKVAAERKRLATLIGRLLARHWLQAQPTAPDAAAQRPSVHLAPGSRKKRR